MKPFIVLAVLVIILMGLLLFPRAASERTWEDRIGTLGAADAYEVMAREVAELSASEQHEVAHAFGKALYETVGLPGLPVCDDRFLYGCVHEFSGQAIAAEGLAVVEKLDEACVSAFDDEARFCRHGVGHGLLGYLGYTGEALLTALRQCDAMSHQDAAGGCYGGVFMEYNQRQMTGSTTAVRRAEQHHEPCRTLDEQYQPACYFWLPSWWRHGALFNFGSEAETYAQAGVWCRAEPDEAGQEYCLRGIGNIIAPGTGTYNVMLIETYCRAAAADDARSFRLCITEAAHRTKTGGHFETAQRLCRLNEPPAVAACEARLR